MANTKLSDGSIRRVLGIETATRIQSFALIDNEALVDLRQQRLRFNHGSTLLANLEHLLEEQALSVHDIDLFSIALGPGSFTGLRVGMAIAKALARATTKPIVGVSSLAALAYPLALTNPGAVICAALDARRQEAYTGIYQLTSDGFSPLLNDCALSPAKLSDMLMTYRSDFPVILVGDAPNYYPQLQALQEHDIVVQPDWLSVPCASSVAVLGKQRFAANGSDDLVTLEPNYVRPSDAELRPIRSA